MSWKRPNVLDRMGRLIKLPETSNGYWLDVGTGGGVFTRVLLERYPNVSVIQMDIRKFNLLTSSFLGAVQGLPIRKGINGIIAAQIIHFLPKRLHAAIIDHLGQRLEENGRIIIVGYVKGNRYPWVPYHISEQDIKRICDKNNSLTLINVIHDEDKGRPKFAAYLGKNYT